MIDFLLSSRFESFMIHQNTRSFSLCFDRRTLFGHAPRVQWEIIRRLHCFCSSIGIPPPRLHCDRAANYGSIIVRLSLSSPARLQGPGFAALALSLCLSRLRGPAAWLKGSSPYNSANVSDECVFSFKLFGFHYAIGNFLDKKKPKLFENHIFFRAGIDSGN